MAKQTIEIDVPEGRKISVSQTNYDDFIQVNIYLEEEEPEFIEVRDFLIDQHGEKIVVCNMMAHRTESETEGLTGFIKWLGEPRKVEI